MKNLLLSIMLALFPLAGFAQTYAGLWKEVAAYQQKDLPKSAKKFRAGLPSQETETSSCKKEKFVPQVSNPQWR